MGADPKALKVLLAVNILPNEGILHGFRKYEDFRTVLPLLDLVKSKFPMEIRQKLHDLEFQTGSDFDLDQVMQKLGYIINSRENDYRDAEAVIAIDIVRRDETIIRQVQNAELVAARRSKNAHVLDRDITVSQVGSTTKNRALDQGVIRNRRNRLSTFRFLP
ncbi:unnamed protein product [Heligmosomoides polygyrus]|uniref:Reverse transcriptase domain-containing protein n=1 Tax=Heligmosomoides polygyrus TaxID=6339 RepID=A0A183G529_HELPZ|nr:unnamed protein product [Heligmosomoides polygyrus]